MTDRSAEHTPGASDPVAVVRRLLRPNGPRLSFHQRFDAGLWMAAGLTAGGAATVIWTVQRARRR
jgi:hypothetical protein